MKKSLMILGNVLIVLVTLVLVSLYVGTEQRKSMAARTEAFENLTVAMENVTANYLTGEQQVCTSWANHINANPMTAQEAILFVRDSLTSSEVMGHILFTEGQEMAGLSTHPRTAGSDDYAVSYKNVSLFSHGFESLFQENGKVSVTRIFTNPINAIQSIAFCSPLTLKSDQSDEMVSAVLLRLIPVSVFEGKWDFPTEEYKDADIALIDTAGDYIIKGHTFKNSNFYEFYQSYNNPGPAAMEQLMADIRGEAGVIRVRNSTGGESLVAHARVSDPAGSAGSGRDQLDPGGHGQRGTAAASDLQPADCLELQPAPEGGRGGS